MSLAVEHLRHHEPAGVNAWRDAVLCGLLVLCANAYSLELTSFLHAKEAVLAFGMLVLAFLAVLARAPLAIGFKAYLPLWVGLGLALGVDLIARPVQVPAYTVEKGLRIVLLLTAATLVADRAVDPAWRQRTLAAVIASAALAAGLGLLQYFGLIPFLFPVFPGYDQPMYSVFGNQNLLGGYLAIALAVLVAQPMPRPRSFLFKAVLFSLLLAALVLSASRGAWLAALCGGLAAAPWRRVPWKRTGLAVLGVLVLVTALIDVSWPQTAGKLAGTLSGSDIGGRARLWFWDGAVRLIADYPVFGAGLGQFPYYSPYYLGAALHAPGGDAHYANTLHLQHAHNEYLHWLAETGIVGALFLVWLIMRANRRGGAAEDGGAPGRGWLFMGGGRRGVQRGGADSWDHTGRAAVAGLVAIGVNACFSSPFHSAPHALAALLFAAMLIRPREAPAQPPVNGSGLRGLTVYLAVIALTVAWVWTTLIPSALLRQAQDAHIAGAGLRPAFGRALTWPWPAYEAHEDLGLALLEGGAYERAYTHLRTAHQGIDTGEIYWLLAQNAAALGRPAEARRWLEACLWRWPRFEPAKTLRGELGAGGGS